MWRRTPRQEIRMVKVKGAPYLWTAWIRSSCGCPGWWASDVENASLYAYKVFRRAKVELAVHKRECKGGGAE